MRIVWIGNLTNSFIMSREIRQGDPISLYLFVLYIKHLSHIIILAVDRKIWKLSKLAEMA